MNEEQEEEIEALKAIYDEDLTEISRIPPCFMIKIPGIETLMESIYLKITLSEDYPNSSPEIEVPARSKVMSAAEISVLVSHLQEVAVENIGMAMVFTLVDAAQQWITDNIHVQERGEQGYTDQSNQVDDMVKSTTSPVKLLEPKMTGGRWDYVIGLVGKPSAGKSTFFNACTTLDLAKTGAHPFTTIEPNVGKAFCTIPCPCTDLEMRCDAAHGHNYLGERHIPVLLKDVAGLVPGAWEGKGRGNRFLNDLLDADVLIHIVDVSGQTNEKGEETTDYDPASDIQWLQQELHQWIYQNVHSRWDSIVKRPAKLVDMFTGYHANRAVIHQALRNAGIGERELGNISTWDDKVLHDIVDNFLGLRFPVLLALNKADMAEAEKHICRIQELYPDIPTIPVSARSECILQQLAKDGFIEYQQGADNFKLKCDVSEKTMQSQLNSDLPKIVSKYGSTNVHKALIKAVNLHCPTFAFPVRCLDTLRSLGRGQLPQHKETDVLRDCISLKPGSTVEDLYNVMCHYPTLLLTGDFVRAETLEDKGKKRPLKKDEVICPSNQLIHIMTTKKSS